MTSRPSTAANFLALLAIALPLFLSGLYVGGYLWLGERRDVALAPAGANSPTTCTLRTYSHAWQVSLFKSAGKFEAWLRGHKVVLAHYSGN